MNMIYTKLIQEQAAKKVLISMNNKTEKNLKQAYK